MYDLFNKISYPLVGPSTRALTSAQSDALRDSLVDFRLNVYGPDLPGVPTATLTQLRKTAGTVEVMVDVAVNSDLPAEAGTQLTTYLAMDGTGYGDFSPTFSDTVDGVPKPAPGGSITQLTSSMLLSTEAGPSNVNSNAQLRDSNPMASAALPHDYLKDHASFSLKFKGKATVVDQSGVMAVGFYNSISYIYTQGSTDPASAYGQGLRAFVGFLPWNGKWRASVIRNVQGASNVWEEPAHFDTSASVFAEHDLEVHISEFGNKAEMFVDGVKVLDTYGTLPNRDIPASDGVPAFKDPPLFYGAFVRCASFLRTVGGFPTLTQGVLTSLEVKNMEAWRYSPAQSTSLVRLGTLRLRLPQTDVFNQEFFRVHFDTSDFLGVGNFNDALYPYVPPPYGFYYDGYITLSGNRIIVAFNSTVATPVMVDFEPSTVAVFSGHRVDSLSCRNMKPLLVQTSDNRYEYPSDGCTGDVKFVPGANCSISVQPATRTVVISAQKNANDTQEEQCGAWNDKVSDKDILCNEAIYSISGAEPDDNGDIQIKADIPLTVSSLRAQDITVFSPDFSAALSEFQHIMRFIYVGLPKSAGNPNVLDCDRV